ncbi:cysteine hydrolase family protein [Kribbella sp. VKM Ac-2566]|uniref:cysteine hydrolase family protein n=1 Tax=Kribbella sp. VKM Ac-2566 TaxID=2512218 RepID=UPI001064253F|nr:cysteine hydrolase family protein [Kribbella sp. VKM Ac-2566]TDX08317.1 nicotinamidase-related amidase [Kribbella sp. VKM Ac-2566]
MRRALVVIDVQNEYETGRLPIEYPSLDLSLRNIGRAMDAAQANDIPVVVVQDTGSPDDPVFAEGSAGWKLHEVVSDRPRQHLVRKVTPGAFTGNDLDSWLRTHHVDTVAIVGFMAHHCVDTSARQAMHVGYAAEVLADATGTVTLSHERGKVGAKQLYETTMIVLHSRFAAVVSTDEWLKASESGEPLHPAGLLASIMT